MKKHFHISLINLWQRFCRDFSGEYFKHYRQLYTIMFNALEADSMLVTQKHLNRGVNMELLDFDVPRNMFPI